MSDGELKDVFSCVKYQNTKKVENKKYAVQQIFIQIGASNLKMKKI